MSDRNPIIIPERQRGRGGCPSCGHAKISGRNIQGVVTFTCKACKHKWQGGLPQTPQDPRVPLAPAPQPDILFTADRDARSGDVVKVNELRKRADPTQAFRKGAPIDDEGEY